MRNLLIIGLIISTAASAFAQDGKWVKWEVQGDTLMSQENFPKAIKKYTQAIKKSKLEDPAAYSSVYKRSVAHFYNNDLEAALADVLQLQEALPDYAQAHILGAFIYGELGEPEHQLEEIKTVQYLQPGNAELSLWMAEVYLELGDYEEAKSELLAVKDYVEGPELYAYLGFAYYNLNAIDSAIVSMNKAIEIDPNYIMAYLYAGSFCLEYSEYELALKYLDVARKLDPANTAVLFYRGVALVEQDQLDQGCQCLNKAFYSGEDDAASYLTQYCYGIE